MTIATVEVAESFGLSEAELVHQALVSFLREQRRQVLVERFEIFARYRADSLIDLEAKITRGETGEHPAWEDLITVENLSARLEKIDAFLRSL